MEYINLIYPHAFRKSRLLFILRLCGISAFFSHFTILYGGTLVYLVLLCYRWKTNKQNTFSGLTSRLLKNFIRWVQFRIKDFFQSVLSVHEGSLNLSSEYRNMFAVFMLFYLFLPYLLWDHAEITNSLEVLVLRSFAGMLCIGLIAKDFFSTRFQNFYPMYWNITLMFCLPFLSTVVYSLNPCCFEWQLNIILSVFLLSTITHWRTFISTLSIGIALGIGFHMIFMSDAEVEMNFQIMRFGVYTFLFSIIICFLFIKRKDVKIYEKIQGLSVLGTAIAHEVRAPITAINTTIKLIKDVELSKNEEKKMVSHVEKLALQGLKTIENLLTQIRCLEGQEFPNYEKISVEKIIKDAVRENSFVRDITQIIQIDCHNDFIIKCNIREMKQVIVNLIENSLYYTHNEKNPQIIFTIKIDEFNNHIISCWDNGEGVAKKYQSKIFHHFFSTKETGGTGIGLAFCYNVVTKIGGFISCKSIKNKYTEFIILFSSAYMDNMLKSN